MPLTIAYSNPVHTAQKSHPDGQNRLRKNALRESARQFKLGSLVWIENTLATVVAYNISEFGRWTSTSHPVLVRRHNGDLQYCRPCELKIAENPSRQTH